VGSTEVRSTSKRSGEEKERRGERLGEVGGDRGGAGIVRLYGKLKRSRDSRAVFMHCL